jgi:hypothetical protein
MNSLIRVLAVSLALSVHLVYADGPMLGRDKLYSEGSVILLRLTKEQKIFLEKEYKSQVDGALRLTPEQTKKLKMDLRLRQPYWKFGTPERMTQTVVVPHLTLPSGFQKTILRYYSHTFGLTKKPLKDGKVGMKPNKTANHAVQPTPLRSMAADRRSAKSKSSS